MSSDPEFVGTYYVVQDLHLVERGTVVHGVRKPGGVFDR